MYKLIKSKLLTLYYKRTMPDFEIQLEHAKKLHQHILDTTKGGVCLSYDMNGNQIRGILKTTKYGRNEHPLITKYKYAK